MGLSTLGFIWPYVGIKLQLLGKISCFLQKDFLELYCGYIKSKLAPLPQVSQDFLPQDENVNKGFLEANTATQQLRWNTSGHYLKYF